MRRVCVRGIIEHEGKLLIVRHVGSDFLATPGGGLDDLETLESGLKRELLEELGVEPLIGSLLYIQQYKDEHKEFLEFFYHIVNGADYTDIDLSSTTHGVKEIDLVDFIDPTDSMNLLPMFLRQEFAASLSSGFSHPIKVFDNLTRDES